MKASLVEVEPWNWRCLWSFFYKKKTNTKNYLIELIYELILKEKTLNKRTTTIHTGKRRNLINYIMQLKKSKTNTKPP